MEKAKISTYQLFTLIVLFELSSAILIPLGLGAKQDAWLAILLGMAGGCFLFLIYYSLYQYYPRILPTEYMQKLIGRFFGRILGFLYIFFFLYLAARVLRDFGEMLLTVAYPSTPLFIVNAALIVVVVYTVKKGIEVLARTGELFIILVFLLAITSLVLIVFSGLIEITNLQPVMEVNITEMMTTVYSETLFMPFAEVLVFTMIFPYLDQPKKLKRTGLFALGLSGIALAATIAINISVLGVNTASRSQFPLLSTIQFIEIADFIERLDIYFMLALVIGGFFKISVFLYAASIGAANLFTIKNASQLTYPMGFIILILSVVIASSFPEHIYKVLQTHILLFTLVIPFFVVIPVFLLIIAFFKNRN